MNVVRYLVENKEDSTSRIPADTQGGDALVIAARNGHLDVVRYLVNPIPDPLPGITAETEDAAIKKSVATSASIQALSDAVKNGHVLVVKFLLENCSFAESKCDEARSKADNVDIIASQEEYKSKLTM